jgi:hypothetical protein
MMFETVEAAALPGSRFHEEQVDLRESPEDANLATIIRRMRKQDQPPIDYGEDFEKAPALSFVGDSPAPQARPLPVAPAAETEPARRHPVAPSSAGAEARAGGRPFGQPPAASPADDPHPSGPGAGPAVRTERANDLIRGFRSARG